MTSTFQRFCSAKRVYMRNALDKIFGFEHAVEQAQSMFKPRPIAIAMILIGLFVEVVLHARGRHWHRRSGVCLRHRRLLRGDGGSSKQFRAQGDFWSDPDGNGRQGSYEA